MFLGKAWNSILAFFRTRLPEFLNNNFEISSTKRSKLIGAALSFVTLIAVILDVNAYTSQEFASKWLLLAFALFCPFILGFTAAYSVKIKNDLFNKIWHMLFMLLMPFVTITMTECLNDVFIYDMTYLGFLGNYLLVVIMYFIIFALSGSFRLSYLIVNPILYGLGLAHSYIMDFRGTPFLPMDFLSIKTAAGVANTYNYTPTYKVMTASLIFIFIIIIGVKTKTPKYNLITKIISRAFTGAFAAVLLILFYFTSVFADMGVRPDFWNQTRGYHNYGFAFNFFCNTKYMYMSEPNNYNPDELKDYVNSVVEGTSPDKPEDNYAKPNIICIMNESLADLNILGNLTTNEDYMPFMRSLTENTVKGNLYVPVIGAGTSNTEFEFLTGHTTAFLPSGSNAYMLYIKNPLASLVSTLKAQGYSSYALHPYYAQGWNRTEVYKHLGFNKFTSLQDIMDISLMREYQNNGSDPNYLQSLIDQYYPGSNMLIRQYVSDSYDYKLLIEDYENRDKSQPYFAFNVTMQNHGGYTTSCVNFDESIYATSVSRNYNKANKYLSLVKASDDAFRELIDYFTKVKEPTIICMFGDHQPTVETEFIAEVMGVDNLSGLSPEQEQLRHTTPFIIWANYDIEEMQIDKLSSNYLSSLVLKVAGVKLTEYNKYLLKLAETLPVIDTVGYIDNENNYYKWSDVSPYSSLLDEYEKVQYNNIFDQQNINSDIFYINGYVPEDTPDSEDSAEEDG
ncbi:MAG: LTA synthase family protein [Acutalibacteraceae bacterium]